MYALLTGIKSQSRKLTNTGCETDRVSNIDIYNVQVLRGRPQMYNLRGNIETKWEKSD